MFDDAWRTMKYRFYDAKMHGKDWDAMRAKYKPLVAFVGDRHELMNIINEMIGELNASHTGASAAAAARRRRRPRLDPAISASTSSADDASRPLQGRPRLRGRPGSTRTGSRSRRANYLIAIDGKPVKTGDDCHGLPRPAAQPQGRADVERQARGGRLVEAQV